MRILGIETSCDETSVAVLELKPLFLKLTGFTVSSQTKLHAHWGGVVPELAARQHAEAIIPLLNETLNQAKVAPNDIDLIAVTQGPGLITALQVGVETAKALAVAWQKPLIGVNHIAGHLVSPFLNNNQWPVVMNQWPTVALVVSGGHTELYLMSSLTKYKLLGRTLDDAAGEAFDKVAKMLGLPYPGGPQISKFAALGNTVAFNFPRPLLNRQDYNFSFAGLKTAVLYTLQKMPRTSSQEPVANICASFQQAVIDVLVNKTLHAAEKYKVKTVIMSGGVSANSEFRRQMDKQIKKIPNVKLFYPDLKFTGDNAAMIALAGALQAGYKIPKKLFNTWQTLQANANWELWN